MLEILRALFSSEHFMPHGHCYLWEPGLLWLQVVSNALIGSAYVVISLTLAYLVKQGDYLPFKGMALAFGIFIVSCGMTHFMDVYVIWEPAYWLDGSLRAVTAVASVGTAFLLPPLVPKAVALARGAKAAHQRGIELEAAVEDLANSYAQTKALDELKSQFFANVSHELRTPLTLILAPVQKLLAADHLSPEQRYDLELVQRNARTLSKHVHDLLDAARLEANKLRLNYTTTDLAELVRSVAEHFNGVAAERRTQLTVEAPETLQAEVDPEQLQRVVLNLLSNAFKFTDFGGRVRCTLTASDADHCRLDVSDSGPGVAPQQRTAIFERFVQAERGANRRFAGTGLGLSIAKDFIELHRGSIEVGEAPEGGAQFRIRLPLKAPEGEVIRTLEPALEELDSTGETTQQALDELRLSLSPPGIETEDANKPIVVVAEDNRDMNRFICEILAPDYRTRSAFDGRAALAMTRSLKPDLIVSDVMMPEVGGEELVREVRSHAELARIPILLLTAKVDDGTRARLLREGVQDYVTKPFAVDELLARAANLIAMKRSTDVLQQELGTQLHDLEQLAREATQRKRELDTALDSMRVAREHAERASQLKTNFLSMVSHELRSPLTQLGIQLERMRVERPQLPASPIVERMARSVARLRSLIEGLLEYASIQSGRLSTVWEEIDGVAMLMDVVDELSPQAAEKGLEVALDMQPGPLPLWTDRRMLRIVLVNLLSNAIKFTERGRIGVSVANSPNGYEFVVSDTGLGIPKREQGRIFEPFEQLEPMRKKHLAGVGLGLALVREMVDSLEGSLELNSTVGSGSTFTVLLPTRTPAKNTQE